LKELCKIRGNKYPYLRINAIDFLKNCTEEEIEEKLKENISKIKVHGVELYDPRDGKMKLSSNPALVMADLAKRGFLKADWRFGDSFWEGIKHLANFCDNFEIPLCLDCGKDLRTDDGVMEGGWKIYQSGVGMVGYKCNECNENKSR